MLLMHAKIAYEEEKTHETFITCRDRISDFSDTIAGEIFITVFYCVIKIYRRTRVVLCMGLSYNG